VHTLVTWLGTLTAIALVAAGCTGTTEVPPGPNLVASGSASAAPSTSSAPIARELGRVLSRAGETMDPLDLAELATTAGASRLAELLDDPSTRATAIAALGYAPDAEVAYARMASEARAHPGPDAEAILDAFARSLELPTKRGEWLDDEGTHAAVRELLTLARDTARTEAERASAVTILRRLAARGFVGAKEIPAL
jgi:hypothetical protein